LTVVCIADLPGGVSGEMQHRGTAAIWLHRQRMAAFGHPER